MPLKLHFAALLATALLMPQLATAATSAATPIDIPYTLRRLDNGLTVVVHEDRKAPIVAVNVWYHVGSKNEVRGRTQAEAVGALIEANLPPA